MKQSLGSKTLLYPAPLLIVATYDDNGKPNAMAAAWGGICCSKPPCISVSLREATYSYSNIKAQQAFTVNIPAEEQMKEADYFGIASGRDADKFDVTGLTPVGSELVSAPYVAEFPVVLECKLLHTLEIGLHTLFVGEVLDVKADENVLNADGVPDMTKVNPLIFDPGTHDYYSVNGAVGKAFQAGRTFA